MKFGTVLAKYLSILELSLEQSTFFYLPTEINGNYAFDKGKNQPRRFFSEKNYSFKIGGD